MPGVCRGPRPCAPAVGARHRCYNNNCYYDYYCYYYDDYYYDYDYYYDDYYYCAGMVATGESFP